LGGIINWEQFEKINVTKEMLENSKNMDKLLNWQKTDLMPISLKIEDNTTIRTDARLSLRQSPDGELYLAINALRKEPELERPYFGIQFSLEDKRNLVETGNLGRIANAEFKPGETTLVLISIDSQTNELVSVRADKLKVPDFIKDVQLNEQQKKELSEGKAVWIDGMTSKKGSEFSAYFQYNADKKGFEFRFDNDRQSQNQEQKQQNTHQIDVPKTFRKVELSQDQRDSLSEGKTVHISGLEDKKGQKYSGYITLNKENGKTDFMFPYEYKKAASEGRVIPDDRHKTQTAVNSEGKTNEATKNLKEPLQKGQTKPTEKQAEKQKEVQKPQKSKGIKFN
jgi:hypothetical protein